ncbi:hypothetical protein QTP70_023674 [Hemibagrus guttatus]|uniref:Gypsy retrotransposon integrase-like protein 1 n=1 Tax=Hemibagrus guttatus TaxID=175788 RepID=A0AAE0QBE3_9TELE|nr:hypothetical protein QTP70_023674 [Hemibagrus guttatus]
MCWWRSSKSPPSPHKGEVLRWSLACESNCFHDLVPRPCLTSSVESPKNLSPLHIPRHYEDFKEVFSKEKATNLSVHRAWDCARDLLPSTTPPRIRVYPLSLPEAKAMEEYTEEALFIGHIQPSTSLGAAGFFFIAKKDGRLHPCIDYRGLNVIMQVIQWVHEVPSSGHPGIHRSTQLMQRRFWWPSLRQDVERYIRSCSTCAQTPVSCQLPEGLLEPLPTPQHSWSHLSMDFLTDMPNSGGFTTVMVMVYRFWRRYGNMPM